MIAKPKAVIQSIDGPQTADADESVNISVVVEVKNNSRWLTRDIRVRHDDVGVLCGAGVAPGETVSLTGSDDAAPPVSGYVRVEFQSLPPVSKWVQIESEFARIGVIK